MGRRLLVLPLVLAVCALAVSAPARADNPGGLPNLSRAETKWIGALVDRFVKDVVLRRDLTDGWKISGPQMRGGLTRKAYLAGNVPVQRWILIGDDFSKSWYATEKIANEYALDVSLRVGRGRNAQMFVQNLTIDRINGHWLVNGWYTNAIVRLGKGKNGSCATDACKITGKNDFFAGSRGESSRTPAAVGSGWQFYALVFTIVGVPLSTLLGFAIYSRSRNRRAWRAYVEHVNSRA
jgi:hypothetical protein